jgi:uncharacterized protein (TIGR00251 family)
MDSSSFKIDAKVAPSASKNNVSIDADGTLRIRVTAPPDKGKANKAVEKLLAKTLGLPKSAISIAAGHASRKKTIAIRGNRGDITRKLQARN